MSATELTKVMLDSYNNKLKVYNKDDATELIRKALVKANKNSDKFNIKTFRDNPALYSIMEELIDAVANEDIRQNTIYQRYVEERNVANGDSIEFEVEDDTDLIVSVNSYGNLGVRRQRLSDTNTIQLVPEMHTIKLYDEFARFMAGRIDINKLVDKISSSIEGQKLEEIYSIFGSLTDNGYNVFVDTGSYTEDKMSEFIDKIEAHNKGAKVMILTTKSCARKMGANENSDTRNEELYNQGYAGKWNGIDVVAVPHRFKAGTETFAFPKDKIFILPVTNDKFIKIVNEGSSIMDIDTTGLKNADQSVNIITQNAWKTGLVLSGKIGVCEYTFG